MKTRLIYSGYMRKNLALFIFMLLLIAMLFVKRVSAKGIEIVRDYHAHAAAFTKHQKF